MYINTYESYPFPGDVNKGCLYCSDAGQKAAKVMKENIRLCKKVAELEM